MFLIHTFLPVLPNLIYHLFPTPLDTDDKSLIFNPSCKNQTLLHYIKRKCDCDREDMIELSDETGAVKNLRNYPHDYGAEYLKERETLILLKVENNGLKEPDEQSDRTTFVPLLSGMDSNKEFLDTLNPEPEELEPLPRSNRSSSSVDPDDIRALKLKTKTRLRRRSEVKGLAPKLLKQKQ